LHPNRDLSRRVGKLAKGERENKGEKLNQIKKGLNSASLDHSLHITHPAVYPVGILARGERGESG